MLEQETAHIIGDVFGKTIGDRTSITLRDVLASDVPRGIKAYLRADIIRALREDLDAAPTFAAVDRTAPGTQRMVRALVNGIAESYTFTRERYRSHLENAVHFLGNYLCRPQWTLESLVFGEGDRVPVRLVRERFEYVAEYGYFRLLIDKVIQQRRWTDVRRDDFRHLLALVDDRVLKEHNPRELALLAKPLYDFLLMRDSPPDARIPLKPVLVFFEDKKMKILRDYVEDICRIRERTDITLDELTALIEDLYLGRSEDHAKSPPAATPAPAAPPPAPAAEVPAETPKTQLVDAPADERTAAPPAPVTEPFRKDDFGILELFNPTEPAEPTVPPDAPPGDRHHAALSLTFAGIADGTRPAGLPTIRSLISDHLRTRFVKHLFDRDEEEYEAALDALDAAPTWKHATGILNDLYRSHALDPFEADVVTFTDTVHRRYTGAE
jgi:hypothetical protein